MDALFYDPRLRLSHRQRDVFARLDSLPPRAPLQDHGYLYGLTAGDLGSASEAVRRALSTRTSDLEGLRRFKTAQIVQAVGGSAGNSGSSRVQGEWLLQPSAGWRARVKARERMRGAHLIHPLSPPTLYPPTHISPQSRSSLSASSACPCTWPRMATTLPASARCRCSPPAAASCCST